MIIPSRHMLLGPHQVCETLACGPTCIKGGGVCHGGKCFCSLVYYGAAGPALLITLQAAGILHCQARADGRTLRQSAREGMAAGRDSPTSPLPLMGRTCLSGMRLGRSAGADSDAPRTE
jgi:hypothetical protein